MNRRQMLGTMGILAAGTPALPALTLKNSKPGSGIFDVKAHGAAGDGRTLDTKAVNRAIAACHAAGGGVVYMPPGTYLSGTVILRSNVTLYLEAGATLLGSRTLSDYSSQPGPSPKADANQRHLVFARDAENVGLAGPGRIDGQGPAFWAPSGRTPPPASEAWRDVATYDWKPLPRPSPMLEFYNCKNLRIEDVRIENSPGWTLRPIQCDHVVIRGIAVKNPVIGPNTDGIDLTCSRNVFISDCLVETGDDALCLKSESPYGGEPRVSKNITITNCVLTGCCNGLKFGTATRGVFENVAFTNSVIFNDDVPLNARIIAGIALEMVDGGRLEGVVISNIRMQRARTPIFIRRGNRSPRPDGAPGILRGVMIENVHATGAILTSSVTGLPGFDVEDVTLSNIRIGSEEKGLASWVERKIPELPGSYPEARMFGRLPAYGFYCRHVKGLRLNHVEFHAPAAEERPALVCDDVRDLDVDGLKGAAIAGTRAVVQLMQTRRAFLHGCSAPPGVKTFLEARGDRTQHIALAGNDLTGVEQTVRLGADVPKAAVTLSGNADK
ncbi:MAG: right-handed parallel beta-helix repeat-containing protein [Verrucomicrobiota bacterium]|nr:right-handed parallel beta-helix repeat-containing protein [Verrucomicrobiota bacterium]